MHRGNAGLHHYSIRSGHDLDLESLTLKTFSAVPTYTLNICGIKITPLSTEIPRHAKYLLIDGEENIEPSPP